MPRVTNIYGNNFVYKTNMSSIVSAIPYIEDDDWELFFMTKEEPKNVVKHYLKYYNNNCENKHV